jgi:hypothetical protein
VVAREVEQLTLADLDTAAAGSVRPRPGVTPFRWEPS